MNSNADFDRQLQSAISRFDEWCAEQNSKDVEEFLKSVELPPEIADELRCHVAREQDFQKMLNPADQGQAAFPDTRTQRPAGLASANRQRIGRYKLLQELGEGGMGTVWMAEQEEPVKRRVALKVIKSGMDTETVIARFEAERQALAIMDHPNIAKVLDAGVTDDGSPYFVMELVKGIPLNTYCDNNKLSIRERLKLFLPICEAVQHAHQKGIIHRDLKPTNVLISLYDGHPVPKVIDFGLAKALDHQTKLTDKTLFTEFGMVVGTLQYMSPEQAEMNSLDVDTRTDIYSLGAMLYELLTGSTPIERDTIKQNAMLQILDVIRHKEPPRPSTRLSESGDAATSVSEHRKINPGRLSQLLKGELDWIVMKSIEKDRNRRYDSAKAFADDVSRFLNDEVVIAKPPNAAYLVRKFINRNRTLVYSAAAIFGILLVSTISLAVLWQKSVVAEQNATQYARRLQDSQLQIARFFDSIFGLVGQERGLFSETKSLLETKDHEIATISPAEANARLKRFELQYGVALTSLGFYLQYNGLAAEQSVKWYQEAIEIFETEEVEDRFAILAAHGTALDNAALMLRGTDHESAVNYINRAIDTREDWYRLAKNDAYARYSLAATLLNSTTIDKPNSKKRLDRMIEVVSSAPEGQVDKFQLSEAYYNRAFERKPAEQQQDVEQAIKYLEEYISDKEDGPTNHDLTLRAKYYDWYSTVLTDPKEKREWTNKAIEIIDQQVEKFPKSPNIQRDAADKYFNHGSGLFPWNNDAEIKESLMWFNKSIVQLEKIRKRDSSITGARVFFLAYMSRAEANMQLGQFKKAEISYGVLVDLLDSENPAGEYTKGENLIRLRHLRCVAESKATEAAKQLASWMKNRDLIESDYQHKFDVVYTAAAIFSLASGVASDEAESLDLANKSVEILKSMNKLGLLKNRLKDLKGDKDLDPIRDSESFQTLVNSLEQ